LSEENAGIEVRREYSVERGGRFELLGMDEELKPGDLLRVDLFVTTPGPRSFVVVDDPVPGALEVVTRDLATASTIDADKAYDSFDVRSYARSRQGWIAFASLFYAFYHREVRHDSVRFYSEQLEPGGYHLSYTAQVIVPGRFAAPPTRAEEMYAPDVFGRGSGRGLDVRE